MEKVWWLCSLGGALLFVPFAVAQDTRLPRVALVGDKGDNPDRLAYAPQVGNLLEG